MQRISVEAFASMVMKNNKGYQKKELVKTLNATLTMAHRTELQKLFQHQVKKQDDRLPSFVRFGKKIRPGIYEDLELIIA